VVKAFADSLEFADCTLERWKDPLVAWNKAMLYDSAFIVDVMHDPGALYEADLWRFA
jgi:hypothetical protein